MLFSNTELPKIHVLYGKLWFTGIAANITSKKIKSNHFNQNIMVSIKLSNSGFDEAA